MSKNKYSKPLTKKAKKQLLIKTVLNELILINEYSQEMGIKFSMNSNLCLNNNLFEQMTYHKWVLAKKVPFNERIRNRYLDYVANFEFPKFLTHKEHKHGVFTYEENHARFNQYLLSMIPRKDFQDEEYDKFRKWCGRITKATMLIYYGFYKFEWEKGRLVDKKGAILKMEESKIRNEFNSKLKIDTKKLKLMGHKYKREKTERPIGDPIL